MVDSRRFAQLLTIADHSGAKIIPMGDANQLQAVEAGPAFRLLTERVKSAVLETVVRQQEEWQRDATRLFGSQQADKALALYLEKSLFKIIEEQASLLGKEDASILKELDNKQLLDRYCLARQMSGRIWNEMKVDYEKEHGKTDFETINYEHLSQHQDYKLYETWRDERYKVVGELVSNFEAYKQELQNRGIDVQALGKMVDNYIFIQSET